MCKVGFILDRSLLETQFLQTTSSADLPLSCLITAGWVMSERIYTNRRRGKYMYTLYFVRRTYTKGGEL